MNWASRSSAELEANRAITQTQRAATKCGGQSTAEECESVSDFEIRQIQLGADPDCIVITRSFDWSADAGLHDYAAFRLAS